jgi:hypothetical protein
MFTRLDIINAMVVSTGSRPFTASQNRHPTWVAADTMLNDVILSVLVFGLWFNTECRMVEPQSSGELLVPQGCIRADPADRHQNFTLRGLRMYDLNSGTYEVGCAVRLKMTFRLDLELIPPSAQEYIRSRAVYDFYLNRDGADPKLSHYRHARDTGWATLYREHLLNKQTNARDNPNNLMARLRKGPGTTTKGMKLNGS